MYVLILLLGVGGTEDIDRLVWNSGVIIPLRVVVLYEGSGLGGLYGRHGFGMRRPDGGGVGKDRLMVAMETVFSPTGRRFRCGLGERIEKVGYEVQWQLWSVDIHQEDVASGWRKFVEELQGSPIDGQRVLLDPVKCDRLLTEAVDLANFDDFFDQHAFTLVVGDFAPSFTQQADFTEYCYQ